jgi:phosphoglycolate phosphatase-like HAD superfamily hydrolase
VRVIVVGDTPRDIEAARAIGAGVVAVATGGYDLDALAAADVAVATLADPRALARIRG